MIVTEPELTSETVQYAGDDGTQINAYLSRPMAPGNYPGVLVVMEAYGLVDHTKDVARRFARKGYIALAPDLYSREGSPDPSTLDEVREYLFASPDSRAVADLEAGVNYLKGLPHCTGKVGAIGFCSGGRYTLILACQSNVLSAAVDSAGGYIVEEQTLLRPVQPMDMIAGLSCPLMATFGEEDPQPTPEHAERLRQELEQHGKTHELYMYRDAGHAFFADYRPSFRPGPAQDQWYKVLGFYDKYLR